MLVAVIKAWHSPITLIIDAVFASLTLTIFPQATLSYSHQCAILHTLSFILYFNPNSHLNSVRI